ESGAAKLVESKPDALGVISAEFTDGVKPVLISTSRISTRNYTVEIPAIGKPSDARQKTPSDLDHSPRPTKLIPTDGVVKAKSVEITKGASTDVEKARVIYE